MTVERLLLELLERGIQLSVDGEDLRFKAPPGALTPDLRERLAERKAELLKALDEDSWYAAASFDQQRLWAIEQWVPGGSAYCTGGGFRIRGPLDVRALERSLRRLSRRHETLRTTLATVDGRPVQVIRSASHRSTTATLPVVDLRGLAPAARELRAASLTASESQRSFDLGTGPLFRILLLRLTDQEWILLLRLHHAISDGWSDSVLYRELAELYGGFTHRRPTSLLEPALQYADFAAWQRSRLAGEATERLLGYWRRQLKDLESLRLPTDRPRRARATLAGASHGLSFAPERVGALEGLARKAGASLYMAMLAAFVALLHRLTGQRDFAVGSPIAGRDRQELEALIGLFVNMLALRADVSGDLSFTELLKRARETALGAFDHQDLPFDRLVAELAPERDPRRHPLFQVSVALHNDARAGLALSDLEVSPIETDVTTVHLDLELHLWRTEAGLGGYWAYSTDLFCASTIARWSAHLATLLAGVASDPERPIRDLPLCSRAQRHQLLTEWNDTRRRTPRDAQRHDRLHQLFERQAAHTPDRVAVTGQTADGRDATLTYSRLNLEADRLARWLRGQGVGADQRVAIFFDRGPERVVAMLAVLKAGGAYLPLAPSAPNRRLAYLLRDARPVVVLTSSALRDRVPAGHRVVCLRAGGHPPTGSPDSRVADLPSAVTSANIAYLLYTSGSTGRPKGTEISHAAICNHMLWMQAELPLDDSDRVLQKTPFTFDASVWEFWAPLQVGAALVLTPPDSHRDPAVLLGWVQRQRATILQVVPSLLRVLLQDPRWPRCTSLRRVLCGGEALAPDLRAEFFAGSAGGQLHDVALHNVYGPTEATIHATTQAIEIGIGGRNAQPGPVAIGRPITNARTVVVDRWQRPAAPGAAGELTIGGAGLARGYPGRAGLTGERFRPDPFAGSPGERLYRTGDLVRHLADGRLTFLGRIDHQLKVRGHRIEPGEIEARLRRHPSVRDAAVVSVPAGEAHRLVACVVAAGGVTPSSRALRTFLSQHLVESMLPSQFIALETLPLSRSGKVDRLALARRVRTAVEHPSTGATYDPPRNPIEELIAASWARLLGTQRVGVRANFFEIGGHSLLAIQALSRVRRAFGVELAVRELFEQPTVASLAARVAQARSGRRSSGEADRHGPVALEGTITELPLSFPQRRLWFLDQLDPGSTAYHVMIGFELTGLLRPMALEASLRELIRRHQVLRTVFVTDHGRPRQRVGAVPAIVLPRIDLAGLSVADRRRVAKELAAREAREPFDLSLGPPMRARLLRLAAGEHVLVLSIHHIAFDGWSQGILCRELSALYNGAVIGEPSPLPEPAIQYSDFAAWQRRRLSGEALEERLRFWRRRLAGLPVLRLPTDRPRPEIPGTRSATHDLEIAAGLEESLRHLGAGYGSSLYMVLLAGFAAFLMRLSGQRDVVVGSPVANRDVEEVEGLIGFFVNMLAMRLVAEEPLSFAGLLGEVRETALAAYDHRDMPFELLAEGLAPELAKHRDGRHHPLFQVTLGLHDVPACEPQLSGVRSRPLRLDTRGARLDLELHLWRASNDEGTLSGRIVYDAGLFDASTIARWSTQLDELLRAVVSGPERPLEQQALMATVERREVLAENIDAEAPFVPPRSPVELTLAGIWAEILNLERIGAHDNFFHLGGHSLMATRVMSRIRRIFKRQLPLRALFEGPTVAGFGRHLEAALKSDAGIAGATPPLSPVGRDRELPLSFAQQRLWFLDRLEPGSAAYHLPVALRLRGALDVAAVEQALRRIVGRHEVLRTVFPSVGGKPRQVILSDVYPRLPVIDLERLSPEHRYEQAQRLTAASAGRLFDLARGSLIRADLVRLAAREHVLLLCFHHIVTDAWSHDVLLRELSLLYANTTGSDAAARLPELAIQYADYAVHQRRSLGDRLEDLLAYWRRQLANLPAEPLSPDRKRAPTPSTRRPSVVHTLELDRDLTQTFERLSLEAGTSRFMTLLAGFAALLGRLTGATDLAVGTPAANRGAEELEGLIGLFVNTLVLRVDLRSDPGFTRLLERVRDTVLDAYAHQDLPFEKLVEELQPERDLNRNPLFQVFLAVTVGNGEERRQAGQLTIEPWRWQGLGQRQSPGQAIESKFDLALYAGERAGRIRLSLTFRPELFESTRMLRTLRQLAALLRGAVADPGRSISELPLLSRAESHQLTREWSTRPAPSDEGRHPVHREVAIHRVFEHWAEQTPDAVALTFVASSARAGQPGRGCRQITYGRLNREANRLSADLRQRGVGPEVTVAVCLERSPERVVAVLGVLKAGGAYLPLALSFPPARLAYMLADSGARLLLTRASMQGLFDGVSGVEILNLASDRRGEACLASDLASNRRGEACLASDLAREIRPLSHHLPHQAAYAVYTSGSTGRPKGVIGSHRGALAYLSWMIRSYRLAPEDVVLQLAPLSFDMSLRDVFGPLVAGARAVWVTESIIAEPADLLATLAEQRISFIPGIVPGTLSRLLDSADPSAFRLLRLLLSSGDRLPPADCRRSRDVLGQRARLINQYGTTESYGTASCDVLTNPGDRPSSEHGVPIGRPLAHTSTRVLDRRMRPAAAGAVGQLHAGSASLVRGYSNLPGLTAEKFLPNPLSAAPGARLYQTGDLVRHRADGMLELVGRVDHQLQLRGQRVEPGEIEAVLRRHPAVAEAVVVARESRAPSSVPVLAAYFTTGSASPDGAPAAETLRAFVARELPRAMVPAIWNRLDCLPRTHTGKIDRRALPAPEKRHPVTPGRSRRPIASPIEEMVAHQWEELLGVEQIGVDENFFELGGHSLLATRVLARVRKISGVELPLRRLFEKPTVVELAAEIEALLAQRPEGGASKSIARLPREPGQTFPLSYAQQRLWFLDRLEPGSSRYNLPATLALRGSPDPSALAAALAEIVARHEILRTTFLDGDGEGRQRVAPRADSHLPLVDLTGLDIGSRRAVSQRLAREGALRPFDLTRGPLYRATLLRHAPDRHTLLLNFHHIVTDGWSQGIFYRELSVLYDAARRRQKSPLEDLAVQYADYAVWQRRWLAGGVLDTQLAYWLQRLAGLVEPDLPVDRQRASRPAERPAGVHRLILEPATVGGLRELGLEAGASLYMILLTVFMTLLHCRSRQPDIAVGSPIAHRGARDIEGLIGFFANTLVLRGDFSADPTVMQALAAIRETSLQAYAHQDVPFERLVEELQPDRELGRAPLIRVMLILQNAPFEAPELAGLELEPTATAIPEARFDLELSFVQSEGALHGQLRYDRSLFDATTIRQLAGHFRSLAERFADHRHRRVSELETLTAVERHALLIEWNDPIPRGSIPGRAAATSLPRLFERQVERTPNAIALSHGDSQITYRQLDAWATRLARRLRALGVGPEIRVGVDAELSPELVIGILAILKAGGAYVPLELSDPPARLEFMSRDTGLEVLLSPREPGVKLRSALRLPVVDSRNRRSISRRESRADLGVWCQTQPRARARDFSPDQGAKTQAYWSISQISQHRDGGKGPLAARTEFDTRLLGPSQDPGPSGGLAYVMYTSGSTGRPKGVGVCHRAVIRLIRGQSYARFGAGETFLLLAPASFDASTLEIWGCLLHGGRLVIPESRRSALPTLGRLLERQRITTLWLTAGLFHLMAQDQPEAFRGLRQLLAGGDVLSPARVRRVLEAAPGLALINGYGPTENTTFTCCHRMQDTGRIDGPIPIGRPIAGSRVVVVDDRLRPVATGDEGQLVAGGDGLARGYLDRPRLTAASFVPDPFSRRPGERLYRTGDLARRRPDGALDFRGRRDGQVKLRGFRVELGEIEDRLRRHPAVREAAVVVRGAAGDDAGDRRLIAFLVPIEGAGFERSDPRAFLAEALPEHMLPAAYIPIDALPLSASGKVDRAKLAKARPRPFRWDGAVPRTPVEEILAESWAALLGLERIGIHDNFFELGGHSLLATRLMSRIRRGFGVELPLRTLFEEPTIARFAGRLEQALELGLSEQTPPMLVADRDRHRELPLSFAQQRLWFLHRLEPASPVYNIAIARRLEGELDVTSLERALGEIVRRHEVLRTTFPDTGGRPRQQIAPAVGHQLSQLDLTALPESERPLEARRQLSEEVGRAFDLTRERPMRAILARLGVADHVLLVLFHHIASDGWSLGIFDRELSRLYPRQAESAELPEPSIQYADFAVWQRRWLRGEALESLLAYWRRKLEGLQVLELPVDRPRGGRELDETSRRYRRGATAAFQLPAEMTQALKRLGQSSGVSLYMTLLAAFMTLLGRLTGQRDVVVGTPIANRRRQEVENLIGFFVNTLVLRGDLSRSSGSLSFRRLLGRVRTLCLEAYDHQDLPFEKLVEALAPERDPAGSPLFQVMFAIQNASQVQAADGLRLAGVEISPFDLDISFPHFDLSASVVESGGSLLGRLSYDPGLFDHTTIARLARGYETLVVALAQDAALDVDDAPLLTPAGRHQLLREWNDTGSVIGMPDSTCAVSRFEARCRRTPDAVAATDVSGHLTYAELDARAERLASRLAVAGVGSEGVVALLARRDLDFLTAVVGILTAGAVYLPLDPQHPPRRLARVLGQSAPALVVVSDALAGTLEQAITLGTPAQEPPPVRRLADLLDAGTESASRSKQPIAAESSAYIIFTSGSTGAPKGAMVSQRGMRNHLRAKVDDLGLCADDVVAQTASQCFDISVWQQLAPLLVGGRVHILEREVVYDPGRLLRHIAAARVSVLETVPSFMGVLLDEISRRGDRVSGRGCLKTLRWFMPTGEALTASLAARWLETCPEVPLINAYGPTECSDDVTHHVLSGVRRHDFVSVPIGRPLANLRVYPADRYLEPSPLSASGELCVAGAGVGRGYLGDPRRTAPVFVPDPHGRPGGRIYRTGDLGRWLAGGDIAYLGRIDGQIKVRGIRIELGDIESALLEHRAVGEAAVLLMSAGEPSLIAYVVASEEARETGDLSPLQLRDHLAERLPAQMVPSRILVLDAMPRLASGKIDRGALRRLPVPGALPSGGAPAGAESRREELLLEIWRDVLGRDDFGVTDSFFDLGGHSLLAVRLMARVEERFETRSTSSLAAFFAEPTIRATARRLGDDRSSIDMETPASATPSPLVRIQAGNGTRPPFFCVHPAGGHVACYVDLARRLGLEQPFYGLQATGDPSRSVPEMAASYVEAMRTAQPSGPYRLGGWSTGGVVAFEMAHQLRSRGEQVALLALLDPSTPGGGGVAAEPGDGHRLLSFARVVGLAAQSPLTAAELSRLAEDQALKRILEELRASESATAAFDIEQLRQVYRIFSGNRRAVSRYEPRAYAGELLLLRPEMAAADDTWDALASRVEHRRVPGDHYAMVREPHVQALARHLRARL